MGNLNSADIAKLLREGIFESYCTLWENMFYITPKRPRKQILNGYLHMEAQRDIDVPAPSDPDVILSGWRLRVMRTQLDAKKHSNTVRASYGLYRHTCTMGGTWGSDPGCLCCFSRRPC